MSLQYGSETKNFAATDVPKHVEGYFKIDMNAGSSPITSGAPGETKDIDVKATLTGYPPNKNVSIGGTVGSCGLNIVPSGNISLWINQPIDNGGSQGCTCSISTFVPGHPAGWINVGTSEGSGYPNQEDAQAALDAQLAGNDDKHQVTGSVTGSDTSWGYTGTSQEWREQTQDSYTEGFTNPYCPIHGNQGPPPEPTPPPPNQTDQTVTIKMEVPGAGSGGDDDGGELGDGGMAIQPSPPPGDAEDPQKLPMSWVWDFGLDASGDSVGTLALISDLSDSTPLDLSKLSTRASKAGGLTVGSITGLPSGQTGFTIEAPEVATSTLQTQITSITTEITSITSNIDSLGQAIQDALDACPCIDTTSLQTSLEDQLGNRIQLQNKITQLNTQISQTITTNASRVRMEVVSIDATTVEVRRYLRVNGTLPAAPNATHRYELTTTAGMPAIRRSIIIGNSTQVDVAAGTADTGANGGRTWRIEAADGTVRVGAESPWASNAQTTDESLYSSGGAQFQQRSITYRVKKPWGVEVVQTSEYNTDAAGAVPVDTFYTFYENAAVAQSYGKLKWTTCSDGTWSRTDYLPDGSIRSYRPWKDSPTTPDLATLGNSRSTLTSADGNSQTESIVGTVVSITTSQTAYGLALPNNPNIGGYTLTQTQRMIPSNGVTLTSMSYVNDATGSTDWRQDESGNITYYEEQSTMLGAIPVTKRTSVQVLQMWAAGTSPTTPPLQQVEYLDSRERLLRTEILAPDGSVASGTDYTYDGTSTQQTQVVRDGQVIYLAQSSTDGSGNKVAIETDAQGGRTKTTTSPFGEVLSQSKLAVDGTTVLLTTATTKTGLTTTTTTTGGGLTLTSVTTKDGEGRTVQQVDENGVTTNYVYEDNGRTVIMKDAAGNMLKTTRQYLDGQLQSIDGPAAVAEFHDYTVDTDGLITETVNYGSATGPMYHKRVTNGLGQLTQDIAPPQDGGTVEKVTLYTYDGNGRVSLKQTTGSAPVKTLYDGLGRATVQRVLLGANGTESAKDPLTSRTWTYATADSGIWAVTTTRQAVDDNPDHDLVSVSKQRIGGSGQVQISQSPDGAILTQSTTVAPAIATVTTTLTSSQATNTATQITINGLLQSQTSLTATTATTYTYDVLERPLTMTTPDGVVHQTVYDDVAGSARSRVKQENLIPAGGGTAIMQAIYTYNSVGQTESVTRADGGVTNYTYDAAGHTLTQSGSAAYPLGYDYDAMGRLWKLHTYRDTGTDDVTTWSYDAASGNLLSKTDATTRSVSYTYDLAGRMHTRQWQRGITTTYSYDGAGRQTGIDYSDSTPDVSTTYDRAGRRGGIMDAAGIHTLTYDAASGGQLAGWSVSGNGVWSGLSLGYSYNGAGRRDGRSASLDGTTLAAVSYVYDTASGSMTSVSSGGIMATYRYNAATGWNQGLTYSTGLSSTRTPDALGRLDAVTWTLGVTTVSGHDYTLNDMNRRIAAQRQDGSTWSYDYNSRGEVSSAAKVDHTSIPEPGEKFAFAYDGIGNRSASSVTSLGDHTVQRTTGYNANALNQYESTTHPSPGWLTLRGRANTTASVTVDGQPLQQRSGELWFQDLEIDNTAGAVNRVTEISATRPDVGFNNGPVTTQQKVKLFIPPPSESPTYDLDGNLTSDARWNYAWDGENRLIVQEEKAGIATVVAAGVSVPPTTTRTRLEFSYDAQSRRLTKRVLVATGGGAFVLQQRLVCLYDGWNMIAEIDTTTTAQLFRSYEWGTDISGTMTDAGGVGGLLIECFHALPSAANPSLPSLGAHVPLYDGNGNITELISLTDNSVSARYEYGAFGETISADGGAVALANPFRFSTKYLDVESGLYNYGYRYYDPINGRWLSRDPIGERGGINLYGMVKNDPVNRIDRLGLIDSMGNDSPDYTNSNYDILEAKIFTTAISRALYKNYLGQPTSTVNPFVLTEDQMAQVTDSIHVFDENWGANGVNELLPLVKKWMNQPSWENQPYDVKNVKVSQMAADQVSLGQFRIILNGTLRCGGGEPIFEGKMTFEDNWDLLRHNSGSSTRSWLVNETVDLAGKLKPGTPFAVSSASVSVKQKFSDRYADWSGAKAGRCTHTSGTYYIY